MNEAIRITVPRHVWEMMVEKNEKEFGRGVGSAETVFDQAKKEVTFPISRTTYDRLMLLDTNPAVALALAFGGTTKQ